MKNEELTFDIQHLTNYAIIKEPCTVIVKCNSKLDFDTMYEEDGYFRWITNLKAISVQNLNYIQKLVDSKANLTYRFVGNLLMSGAIWENQVNTNLDLPVKGEDIIATFDYVKEKLLCTNITIIPRIKPDIFKPASSIIKEIELFKKIK